MHSLLTREVSVLELKGKIESQAQQEMTDAQRQYYLRQQLKAIQQELGEGEGNDTNDLRTRIDDAQLPPTVKTVADRELDRLSRMGPASPESQMIRTYIEWILELPWDKITDDRIDPIEARRVLDEDHYDLDKVKERIVEYLAVRKLKGDMKGPIMCFVGPPGVGKTSLGQSIARAMQRKFVRISLGGVRDEAEIRGHRRTYIGALPGRIAQALRQAGSANPVFMLDELDKVAPGYQGDPAAALLEVLDPAQNNSFRDHYMEVPIDLSKVLFIATANQIGPVHPALRDRMEIVYLSGYTEDEKVGIARRYLIPRQLSEHGLGPESVHIADEALRNLIREHTREAGVRNLERSIGAIARKIAARVATGTAPADSRVEVDELETYLGPARFKREIAFRTSRPGVATGVAWTETGGDVLFIEATLLPGGHGQLTLTGQLGEVMQESARAAVSHLRANATELGIQSNFLEGRDLHVHVPAGAIPKDGPSAGVTMATAILSAVRNEPVNPDVAMTGEITLSGLVLPVGGIREKALAAKRLGIKTFVLPAMNEPDLRELPEELRKTMRFVPAATLEQVLAEALPAQGRDRRSCGVPAGVDSPLATVVFYISGHGFGHATRDIELINALVARRPDLRIVIRTSVRQWLFDLTVDAGTSRSTITRSRPTRASSRSTAFISTPTRHSTGRGRSWPTLLLASIARPRFSRTSAPRSSSPIFLRSASLRPPRRRPGRRAGELHVGLDLLGLSREPMISSPPPRGRIQQRPSRCGCRCMAASRPLRGSSTFPSSRDDRHATAPRRGARSICHRMRDWSWCRSADTASRASTSTRSAASTGTRPSSAAASRSATCPRGCAAGAAAPSSRLTNSRCTRSGFATRISSRPSTSWSPNRATASFPSVSPTTPPCSTRHADTSSNTTCWCRRCHASSAPASSITPIFSPAGGPGISTRCSRNPHRQNLRTWTGRQLRATSCSQN